MFKNFYKMILGWWWGFLFVSIIEDIGTTTIGGLFTAMDAFSLIFFLILMGVLSVITYLEIVE